MVSRGYLTKILQPHKPAGHCNRSHICNSISMSARGAMALGEEKSAESLCFCKHNGCFGVACNKATFGPLHWFTRHIYQYLDCLQFINYGLQFAKAVPIQASLRYTKIAVSVSISYTSWRKAHPPQRELGHKYGCFYSPGIFAWFR